MRSDIVNLLSAAAALLTAITVPLVTWSVGKGQINANVVVASRQRQIEMLRDLLAEFTSQVTAALILQERRHAHSVARPCDDALIPDRIERMVLITSKVRLLINPSYQDQRELYELVEQACIELRLPVGTGLISERMSIITDAIVRKSQVVFQREWLLTKGGN